MVTFFRLIGAFLSAYLVLLFIRILLTWFSGPAKEGRAIMLLYRVTDPYLDWFRRFSFLRAGSIDFSPMAAIIVLVVIQNIFTMLAVYGKVTIGIVLALITSAVGSAFFFAVGFFLLLAVIRTVSVFVSSSSLHPVWQTLDMILNPILAFIQRTLFRSTQMAYRNILTVSSGILLVVYLVGRILLNWLVAMLASLPF